MKLRRLALLLVATAPATWAACTGRARANASAPEVAVHAAYLRDLDSLAAAVRRLERAVATASDDSASHAALRDAFTTARARYKRVEYLVELFTPTTADLINGPVLDEIAEDDPNQFVIPPEGFQVVEEQLYSAQPLAEHDALRTEVRVLLANVARVRHDAAATPLTARSVWDAMRLQVARLVTLGLAGFDSPVALRALPEGAEVVRGLRDVVTHWTPALRRTDAALADTLEARLTRAQAALDAGGDFATFDRLAFLVDEANPLARALLDAQRALGVPLPDTPRAWRATAATPFDADAFDARYFAPGTSVPATPAMVALGRDLFFDPVLSRGERRACASCHQPERGFTDGLSRSLPPAPGVVRRNAPTVVNAALQGAAFHDLRTTFLEDQVADVVGNADEMHRSLAEATAAVHARADYRGAFRAAFGEARDDRERQTQLRQSLAAYLRSLQALDSRFDRYVRGDRSTLTAPERDGFNLFMGKARCGTCHFAPLFNGVVPPLYVKTESEVLGVPARPVTARAVVDPDLGRFLVTRLPVHRHAFKTPTLRNVALTAPYMHNGVYRTLEEVVDFYDGGGGAGIGIALPNQTLPTDSLRLTAEEKRALVAFMQALTDTTSVRGRVVVGGASGVR